MLTLFRVNKNTGVSLHPEIIQLSEHIKKLNSKELGFLVDWVDYHGSFWQYIDEETKKIKSWKKWFGETEIEISPLILKAKEEYSYLQYDVDYEILNSYKKKILLLTEQLMDETSHVSIKAIDSAISALQKRIEEMESKIKKTEDEIELKGDRKLSFLEKINRNKKREEQERLKKLENEMKEQQTETKKYADDF